MKVHYKFEYMGKGTSSFGAPCKDPPKMTFKILESLKLVTISCLKKMQPVTIKSQYQQFHTSAEQPADDGLALNTIQLLHLDRNYQQNTPSSEK